jgi:hypothetical protein
MHLAVDLHLDLDKVPFPLPEAFYPTASLTPDDGSTSGDELK